MAGDIHPIEQQSSASADPRLGEILDLLIRMGAGDLSARLNRGQRRDEVEGIIAGLNMMAEELEAVINDLSHRVAAQSALIEIDREIILKSKPQTITEKVCQQAAELLNAPIAFLVVEDGYGPIFSFSGLATHQLPVDLDALSACSQVDDVRQLSNGINILDQDSVSKLVGAGFVEEENIQTAALAAVKSDNKIYGSLMVFDTEPREWDEDETELLVALSGQTAIAIDSYELFIDDRKRREELRSLYDLSRALNDSELETDSILNLVVRHAVNSVHVTFVQAVLIEDGHLVTRAAHPIRLIDRDLLAGFENPGTGAFLKGIMQQDAPVVIKADEVPLTTAEKSDLFRDIARIICIVPLHNQDAGLGLLILGEARGNEREPFSDEKIRLVTGISDQTVSALKRVHLFQELESSYLETVLALANAIDAKDRYTGGHGRQMAAIALKLGESLGMHESELNNLHYGALLHDIGKIGISDSILLKPGSLNGEEWIYIFQHPLIGEKIISPVKSLRGAANVVRHHHERYDGNGYPDRLAGDEIPLGARILAVIDAFCAIVDQRSYKQARPVEEAFAELSRCAGSQFDPMIVDEFYELWKTGEIHYDGGPPG